MKKLFAMILALVMMMALVACGGSSNSGESKEAPDLNAYYEEFMTSLGEDNTPMMMDITEDMWADLYPGLGDYELKQAVIKTAAMGAVAFEFALVECANEGDVEAVKGILQSRVDNQASGGAWYPATIEAWQNAEVIVNGNVVAMIVAGDVQADAVSAFNGLFA